MLEYLKEATNTALTENGAVTCATTGSDCLDFFAAAGALRCESEYEIISRFARAYAEDKDDALKILFFTRDIRGGLGERRVFRVIIEWLAKNEPSVLLKNLRYIAEYGRYDDLLVLLETQCADAATAYIKDAIEADLKALEAGGSVSLLAKWLPSVNTSNAAAVKSAKKLARKMGMSCAEYRKTLSALRVKIKITENYLRERDYTFDYSKQPSGAMLKYRQAFLRNDGERYMKYLNVVEKGGEKIHTDTLMPYDIVAPCFNWYGNRALTNDEVRALDVMWNNLPDFGGGENALAVVDGSASMYGWERPTPVAVAYSLGIYFAERNRGAFHNHFITFSRRPRLVEIKGGSIAEKAKYCTSFCEVANTDISKVFRLILDTALKNNVSQSEMPSSLYIISDMEFDSCAENADESNFEFAKRLYEENGYKLPRLVFWNVASRNSHQPVTRNERGVVLVSGFTPRLFEMIAGGETDPYEAMREIIDSERYAVISA